MGHLLKQNRYKKMKNSISLGDILKASLETKSGWIVSASSDAMPHATLIDAEFKAECGAGIAKGGFDGRTYKRLLNK